MRMHEQFKRRVRIEGKFDGLHSYHVHIIDVETGEMILNVAKAVITLIPGEYNAVELTYYDTNEDGKLVLKDGHPVPKHIRLNAPEFALTALEGHTITAGSEHEILL